MCLRERLGCREMPAKRGGEHADAEEHEQSGSAKQARLDSFACDNGSGGEENAVFTLENKNPMISQEILSQLRKNKVRGDCLPRANAYCPIAPTILCHCLTQRCARRFASILRSKLARRTNGLPCGCTRLSWLRKARTCAK